MQENSRIILLLAWEFAVHLFVGSALFIVVTLPIYPLAKWQLFLEKTEILGDFIPFISSLKFLVFAVDVALFIFIIAASLYVTIKGVILAIRK